jgi:hypothetical protein
MRSLLCFLTVLATATACGPSRDEYQGDAGDGPPPGCVGLECQVVNCAKKNLPPTTLSGVTYAPNGTLALYGATVYIPNVDPGPIPDGVTCNRCEDQLAGDPVVQTASDTAGRFTLTDVPSGTDIPLFITIGKWRRKVLIPTIAPCQDNPLPNTITSLPKNKSEGDIPKIAVTTGSLDALECLIFKLGVSESEFSSDNGTGRIHLFASNGAAKLANNTPFSTAFTLWGDLNKLKNYDIVMNSCEGSQRASEKTQQMMDNLKVYADFGGRVFNSHFHAIWIEGEKDVPTHAPAVWPELVTCNVTGSGSRGNTAVIDQVNNPKGAPFATWMTNVQGSAAPGTVALSGVTRSCSDIDLTRTERWLSVPFSGTGLDEPLNFQFTTPAEVAKEERCGKVVFSDMHVSSTSSSSASVGFPGGCSNDPLTPQEKALAFMFFDVASCIGPIL